MMPKATLYTVLRGDTLGRIAARFETTVTAIVEANARLVLSGHSVGTGVWGDENGTLTLDAIEALAAASRTDGFDAQEGERAARALCQSSIVALAGEGQPIRANLRSSSGV